MNVKLAILFIELLENIHAKYCNVQSDKYLPISSCYPVAARKLNNEGCRARFEELGAIPYTCSLHYGYSQKLMGPRNAIKRTNS